MTSDEGICVEIQPRLLHGVTKMQKLARDAGSMQVVLAQPRGFCAGVVRAISIVERALEKYDAPVFVRHEIVHNKHVVEDLKGKGARFVDEIDEIPSGAVTIFSAHGVARAVIEFKLPAALADVKTSKFAAV